MARSARSRPQPAETRGARSCFWNTRAWRCGGSDVGRDGKRSRRRREFPATATGGIGGGRADGAGGKGGDGDRERDGNRHEWRDGVGRSNGERRERAAVRRRRFDRRRWRCECFRVSNLFHWQLGQRDGDRGRRSGDHRSPNTSGNGGAATASAVSQVLDVGEFRGERRRDWRERGVFRIRQSWGAGGDGSASAMSSTKSGSTIGDRERDRRCGRRRRALPPR